MHWAQAQRADSDLTEAIVKAELIVATLKRQRSLLAAARHTPGAMVTTKEVVRAVDHLDKVVHGNGNLVH